MPEEVATREHTATPAHSSPPADSPLATLPYFEWPGSLHSLQTEPDPVLFPIQN